VITLYLNSASTLPQTERQENFINPKESSNEFSKQVNFVSNKTEPIAKETFFEKQLQSDNFQNQLTYNKPSYKKVFFEKFKSYLKLPAVKFISFVGVVGGWMAMGLNFLVKPVYFGDLQILVIKIRDLFAFLFGFKKRPKMPWGTVYDSVTKQPIDPAYIELFGIDNKNRKDAITDIDGRYGFLVDPGKYKIIANKSNYVFPSEKLKGKINDELYENLYFGGTVDINEDQGVVSCNIPMDQKNFDWNEFAKKNKKLIKFYSKADRMLEYFGAKIIFFCGFVFSFFVLLFSQQAYNVLVFSLYVVILIFNFIGLKPKFTGRVTDILSNEPCSFAVLRVFLPHSEKEIFKKVCDGLGRYYCLVPAGDYVIKIDKKNLDGSYFLSYVSGIIRAKKGIIRKHFKIAL